MNFHLEKKNCIVATINAAINKARINQNAPKSCSLSDNLKIILNAFLAKSVQVYNTDVSPLNPY